MFVMLFQSRLPAPVKLPRASFHTLSLGGALVGVAVILLYLSAPVLLWQRSLTTTSLSAKTTTPTVEVAGAELSFQELVWLARSAEFRCDEWIAQNPAQEPRLGQKLSFELSCRLGHRYYKVRRSLEKFVEAHPGHEDAVLELDRFTRVMTEKIAAVLEWETLRNESPDSPAAWHSLAVYYNNQGLLARAFQCYEKAASLPQASAAMIEDLAVTQFMFRADAAAFYSLSPEAMVERSFATYRRAMALEPRNLNLARHFAECFFVLRPLRATEGLRAWENVLNLAGSDIETHEALVSCARYAVVVGRLGQAQMFLARLTRPDFAEHKERIERSVLVKRRLVAEATPSR
ncbi:hypothetical protein LBMAG56_41190 [Verrucomicrobiota bacterium]|nr:hypothetical protein LBMAG56_41190 [Verrucomicrobiota bacterium]